MTEFTPIASTLGGGLIGLAAAAMLAGNGRIAGISGIVGGLIEGGEGRGWRGAFVAGMLAGGLALMLVAPSTIPRLAAESLALDSLVLAAVAGLLVGFGTRMGGGCTSGHGICGISRLSTRSLTATALFMGAAIVTTTVVRHVIGGLS